MTEREERIKGLTAKSLIIGIAIVAILAAVYGSTAFVAYDTRGMQSTWGLIFLTMVPAALINYVRPGTFSRQELAVLTVMIMMGTAWFTMCLGNQFVWIALFATPQTVLSAHATLEYFPDTLWGPKDENVVNAIFPVSTMNINFGAFANSLGWAFTLMISMFLSYLFLTLLLRHLMLVREAAPFPMAMFQTETVEMTQEGEKKRSRFLEMKWFWLGWVIGFLWLLPWLVYSPRTSLAGAQLPPEWAWLMRAPDDYTKYALIPWVALGTRGPVEILPNIFFALLWPIEALYGWVFGWLVFGVIFPNIMYSMGWLPAWGPGMSYWSIKFGYQQNAISPYFQNYTDGLCMGLILVFAFYPLWRNRDHFKTLLGGITKRIPEDEDSPLPYMYIWLGFIIFSLLNVGGWMWLGLPWYFAVYLVAILLIYVSGAMWAFSDTLGTSPFYHWIRGGTVSTWQDFPVQPVSMSVIRAAGGFGSFGTPVANATTYAYLAYNDSYPGLLGGFATPSIMAWRVAEDTQTDNKSIFSALVIAGVISILVGSISMLVWAHWYPIKEGTPAYSSVGFTFLSRTLQRGMTPNPWPGFTHYPANTEEIWATMQSVMLGAVYAIAIYLLRARFPWFRVSPTGTLLAMSFEWVFNWYIFIIATAAKYIVLKVWGVSAYNKYLMPLSLGLVIGTFTINGLVLLVSPFAAEAFVLPA